MSFATRDYLHLEMVQPEQKRLTLPEPMQIQLAVEYDKPQFTELAMDGGLGVPACPVT